jgi:phosphopantothenoylcysteine decarboxylase/phosphopantothenate--cysteine ligase
MLKDKHILLGITGSIAAYKAAIIVRLLIKQQAKVKVIMTPLAKEFITPLTLATLSKNSILVDFFNPENGDWNSHVDLGTWADLFVVAPATANTIAKMANGIADNLLLTSYLSARCPVMIAPAMDFDMYLHPATQNNLQTLKSRGNLIIEPAIGELASGLEGKGRMEEPELIVNAIINFFSESEQFKNKKILVTAGPTYESIDPVRFIGNYSSGKMGYAIADELAKRGAHVFLISGPVNISPSYSSIELIKVTSAKEMLDKALALFPNCDAAILTAAVADFRPKNVANQKIKRTDQNLLIELEPNPDIALELGKLKKNQIIVGFALETENYLENAQKKLEAKNFDFIVLNPANEPDAGFMADTNRITIIDRKNNIKNFELKSKKEVAADIVDELAKQF